MKGQIEAVETSDILRFISTLQENIEKFKSSPIPQLFLEVSLAKTIPTLTKAQPSSNEKPDSVETKPPKKIGKSPSENPDEDLDLVLSRWPDIIDALKDYNHSLSSVLKMSQPMLIEGKYLILRTKYSFYNDKITDGRNRLTIEETIDRITGVSLKLKALTEKGFTDQYPDFKEKKSLLQEAVDIFGGKIVEE